MINQSSFNITKIIPETEFLNDQKVIKYGNAIWYRNHHFLFTTEDLAHKDQKSIPIYSLSPIILRHRQAGDRLSFGNFSKKLRRLFIDDKLSIAERQNAIVGEQDGEIIFVLVGDKTYLRKACKHDIMLAKLYIDKLEKGDSMLEQDIQKFFTLKNKLSKNKRTWRTTYKRLPR